MDETERMTERFEQYRPHPQSVAFRAVGILSELNHVVQDNWSAAGSVPTAPVGRQLRHCRDSRMDGRPGRTPKPDG